MDQWLYFCVIGSSLASHDQYYYVRGDSEGGNQAYWRSHPVNNRSSGVIPTCTTWQRGGHQIQLVHLEQPKSWLRL